MPDSILYHCPCGALLINNKCSRRHSVKACKGEQAEKRPRYSGKSNFWDFTDGKTDIGKMGYAK